MHREHPSVQKACIKPWALVRDEMVRTVAFTPGQSVSRCSSQEEPAASFALMPRGDVVDT